MRRALAYPAGAMVGMSWEVRDPKMTSRTQVIIPSYGVRTDPMKSGFSAVEVTYRTSPRRILQETITTSVSIAFERRIGSDGQIE
jgi:hypothetical protein